MVITSVTREEMMAVARNVSMTESPATNEQSLAPENDKKLQTFQRIYNKSLAICYCRKQNDNR